MLRRLAIAAVVLTLLVLPIHADCVAAASASFQGANSYVLTYHYFGTTGSPDACAGTDLYVRWDNGDWSPSHAGPFQRTVDETYTEGHPCYAPGEHTIDVRVECLKRTPDGGCARDTTAYAHASFFVEHAVSFDGATAARFSGTPGSRVVSLSGKVKWQDEWSTGVKIGVYEEMDRTLATVAGIQNQDISGDGRFAFVTGVDASHSHLKLVARACDKYDFSIVGPDNKCGCPDCGDCVGGPIRLANGNMRYADTDPLPNGLSRTYDSTNNVSGWFGIGWNSLLDEWLKTEGEPDGSTTIAVGTASGDRFFFNGAGGAYRQLWPVGPAVSVFHSDGGAGYVLRPYGSDVEHYFTADGRLYKTRQVTNGREVNVSYDAYALVTRVADSWGNWAWNVTTDSANRRITSISIEGTPIVWTYVYSSGNLTAVQESGVTWRSYTYNGPLAEIRDGSGNLIESHSYGPDGATTSIGQTDDITSIVYNIATGDPDRTITRVTRATGAQTDYYIRSNGGTLKTDRVDGGCTSCASRNALYAHDDYGRLVREQNARGYITERTYDAFNRVVGETTALTPAGCDPEAASDRCRLTVGLATATLSPTAVSVTRIVTYDSAWYDRPASITTASILNSSGSRVETMTYDPVSGVVLTQSTSGWTTSGTAVVQETHTTSTTLYDGVEGAAFSPGGAFDTTWTSLPQPAGMRKSIDGPRSDVSDVTTFVYYPIDDSVPGTLRGHLAAVRNAAGHVTRYEDYDAFGNAQRAIDPNGVVSELTFDHLGRPLSQTLKAVIGCNTDEDALCATDLTTSRVYSPATGPLTSQTDAGGNATAYEYDSRGRLSTLSRGPSASDLRERIAYSYDSATGRKSLEQYLAKENGSWVEKRRESFAYDTLGQLTTQTHADSTSIAYTYDPAGSVATVRDENHAAANTTYAYDAAQRLVSVAQTLGTGTITTSYADDIAGDLTGVTDPNGNVTTYVYDDFGRMQSQTSPVTGTTSYSYDFGGNLISTTDANGAMTTRAFDSIGRVLTASSVCSGWDAENVAWTYDDATSGGYGIGRLASMTDPSGSTEYAYDRRGLLRRENRMILTNSSEMLYSYDANGNRTRLDNLDYTYDFAGRPVSVTKEADCSECPSSPIVTSASYLPFGPQTDLVFGAGLRQTRSYDARYRITENKLTNPGAVTLADYSYAEDAAGNVTTINDLTDATLNRSFGYDDLNRLTTANTGTGLWGTGTFSYDSMGNLLSSSVGSWNQLFTYAGTTSKIASVVEHDFDSTVDYDAAGNEVNSFYPTRPSNGSLIAASGAVYTDVTRSYSCRNLMAAILTRSLIPGRCPEGQHCNPNPFYQWTQYDYAYDGRGIRVHGQSSNGAGSDYVYAPDLQLHRIRYSDDSSTEFVRFNGVPVAQLWSFELAPLYTFSDHLGTPLLQTDIYGNVTWRVEHEPYGRVYRLTGGGNEFQQPLRFPGQDFALQADSGAEESYNIFRWYRSGWGRYAQSDVLGLSGGLNVFAYGLDNPISFTDPLGMAPKFPQFPGTTTDDCSPDEWKYCEGECSPSPVLGCYVTVTHKLKTLKGFPQFKIVRTVNCNCQEKDCQKSWPDKFRDWWKDFNAPDKPIIPLIPPLFPTRVPTPEPVLPGLPPFFINPCILNPSLCGNGTPRA